jgi:hypothetical protein
MTRRRSLPLVTLVVLAAGTCAAGAWAGEPVPHDLPDEPLLELIDRLDLPEVRALVQDAGVAETSQDELLERLAGIETELAGTSRSHRASTPAGRVAPGARPTDRPDTARA